MLSDHWELYEALKDRDPEAVHQLMCSHLGSVSEAFARPQRPRAKQTGLNGRR
jgi:DNA-binding FadR family transcriptional regulator